MPPSGGFAQRGRRSNGGAGDEAERARRIMSTWDPHVVWINDTTFRVESEGLDVDDEAIGDFVWFLERQVEEWHGSSPPRLLASTLNFSKNRISDAGACSLMAVCRRCNISVERLKFFRNLIGDAGAEAIGQYLAAAHRAVQEVHLSHNRISERGARAFLAALSESQKYPFPTEGSKSGARMPLWLRMEYNRIDWASVTPVFFSERNISWCTAGSKDGWRRVNGSPPAVCMHTSHLRQDEAPQEEADPPRPELDDARPASSSSEAEKARPSGEDAALAADSAGPGRGLLDVLQRVAPAASVQHAVGAGADAAAHPRAAQRPQQRSPALQFSQAPIGSDSSARQWHLERAASHPPLQPGGRAAVEQALEVLEALPDVGDAEVYWRWRERVESAEEPLTEARRIGELVRHLVRRRFVLDGAAEAAASKAHPARGAAVGRGGRQGAKRDGARPHEEEGRARLDQLAQALGGVMLMSLLVHAPSDAEAQLGAPAEGAVRASAGLVDALPGPDSASEARAAKGAPPSSARADSCAAPVPSLAPSREEASPSRGAVPQAAEVKSKKGKNKIGAAPAPGPSETATTASSTPAGTSVPTGSAGRSREPSSPAGPPAEATWPAVYQ
ncbi:unnamed protein product [Prorocentrum cordatum]|uniref:Uncharacterized protein n=1 Tax=Prorocentrum cordatum TaxID=2364126 RepID=A0ABN9X5F4_9DINO|nr:unnamed protein product [Polarella glacialis]